jgi:hypothetical protein
MLDVQVLEGEAYGLLPLLHERLMDIAPDYPHMQLLKGVRQRHWYVNSLRLGAAAAAAGALRAGGHEPLLGGAAAVLHRIGDQSMLPLPDVDLILHRDRLDRATTLLEGQGWRRIAEWQSGPLLERRAVRVGSRDGQYATLKAGSPPAFHPSPDEIEIHGQRLGIIAPGNLLVSALVETGRAPEGPALRWAADAAFAWREVTARAEWQRAVEVAIARGVALRVSERLTELEELLDVRTPRDVARGLRVPVGRRELLAERLQVEDREHATVAALLRRTSGMGALATVRTVSAQLSELWGQPSAGRLPGEAARRLLQRVRPRPGDPI